MQIPLETVIDGLSDIIRQGKISREDGKAVVDNLISSVYDARIDAMIQRMHDKKREAIETAKYSL